MNQSISASDVVMEFKQDFLEAYEGGADPSEDQLKSIQEKRAARMARQTAAAEAAE